MQTQLTMAETLEVPEDKVEDFQETAKDMEEDYSTVSGFSYGLNIMMVLLLSKRKWKKFLNLIRDK